MKVETMTETYTTVTLTHDQIREMTGARGALIHITSSEEGRTESAREFGVPNGLDRHDTLILEFKVTQTEGEK